MSKKLRRIFAGALAFVMLLGLTAVPTSEAKAAVNGTETVQIGESLTYTGVEAPGYTFDSAVLTEGGMVGAMVFNIKIDIPAEGDVAWNDWCGELIAVKANDTVKYYDFGGAQVGWGTDADGDQNADTTGVGTASWVGSVSAQRTCTVVVPVNAEDFTIEFFDNCWDSATDISHYTIHSATAVYGEVASSETVAINGEVTYTGTETSGYTFDTASLTTEGNISAIVFNIGIGLPTEGDITWNDWCGEAAKVTVGDTVSYYDFGGSQVSWGTDMDGDTNPDTTGVGSSSWAGSAENGSISAVFPINAEAATVDFYDVCWDSALEIPHYVINSAVVLFGSIAEGSVVTPEPTPEPTPIPELDKNGVYHAYFGIQTANWSFRNKFDDATYGIQSEEFKTISAVTDGVSTVKKGTITDAEIKGNGTYTVSLTDFDFDDASETLNLLFASTDIPNTGEIKITDVRIKMDGKTVYKDFTEAFLDPDSKNFMCVMCINLWNADLKKGELFAYNMPTQSVEIIFTVSGFDYDNPDAVATTPTTAPAATVTPAADPSAETSAPVEDGSSNTTLYIVIAVIAVIVIAGVVVVVLKKKKK